MSSMTTQQSVSVILLPLLLCVPFIFVFQRYLRVSYGTSFLFLFAAVAAGVYVTNERVDFLRAVGEWTRLRPTFVPPACMLFVVASVALLSRLVRAWVFGDLRDAERQTGAEGVRAWMRGGNLVCAIAIPLTGWYGLDYSPWALGLVAVAAILAYPLLANGSDAHRADRAPATESLRNERERVLRMLEEGAIKADDAADLLSALAATTNSAPASDTVRPPLTSKQRLAFLGGLVLLVSFVLPWFAVNLGREMNRVTAQLGAEFAELIPAEMANAFPDMARSARDMPKIKTPTAKITAADLSDGRGWIVLVCGIFAAFLVAAPYVMRDASLRRMLLLGLLGLGGAMLIYLLGNGLRSASYGIVVAVLGYACIAVGAVEQVRSAA